MDTEDVLILLALLLLLVIVFLVIGLGTQSSPGVEKLPNGQIFVPDGATLREYNSLSKMFYSITPQGDTVTINLIVDMKVKLCDPNCTKEVWTGFISWTFEKVPGGINVTPPFASVP